MANTEQSDSVDSKINCAECGKFMRYESTFPPKYVCPSCGNELNPEAIQLDTAELIGEIKAPEGPTDPVFNNLPQLVSEPKCQCGGALELVLPCGQVDGLMMAGMAIDIELGPAYEIKPLRRRYNMYECTACGELKSFRNKSAENQDET